MSRHFTLPLASLVLLATTLLDGCAYAPGMSIGHSMNAPDAQANPWSITTQRTSQVPGDLASPGVDAPPPGALLSITPELIGQQRAARAAQASPGVKHLFGQAKPYLIGPGDVLNIVVWDHPELAIAPAASNATATDSSVSQVGNGYNISPAGFIQFPYVGTLKLGGLTEYDARDLLTTHLAKYIKDPQITVRIQSYRSGRVYLDGELRTPGLQAVNDIPMTLPEAINRAGGFTAMADRSGITLARNGSTTTINLQQLTAQGINPASILLASGDMLRVPHRDESRIFVLGEVPRAGAQLLRHGRLTLNEALGDAGGINPASGDPRQVYVVRNGASGSPQIFHLDARTAVAYALAEGFELNARDVVFVDPVPLVSWNRVISLILPSAQVVNVSRDAIN